MTWAERWTATGLAASSAAIEAGWLAAILVTPLLFNVYSSHSFEPDKMAALATIALWMGAAWAVEFALGGGPVAHPRSGRAIKIAGSALLVALAVATVLSVDVERSLWGSTLRRQGLLAWGVYGLLFVSVARRLPGAEGWRRIAAAVTLAAVPVAGYALVQQLGLDPHPWTERTNRSASTLGNPVFLGAWLALAALIATERLLSARRASPPARAASWGWLLVLALELTGLVVSQSRGPLLGLLAGLFLASVLLIGRQPSAAEAAAARPRFSRTVVPWAAAALGLLLLIGIRLDRSPLAAARDWPYVGRLSTMFESTSRNALVRAAMWSGSLDLLASPRPASADDPLPSRPPLVRRVFGYGPDSQGLIAARQLRPELARIEGWEKIPDRSHNELYDLLLESGVAGALAQLALLGAALAFAAGRLGFLPRGRDRLTAAAAVVVGAGAASSAALLGGAPAFCVPAFSGGALAGFLLYLGARSLVGPSPSALPAAVQIRIALLGGALVAHFVEIQFGFGITATRSLVAVLLGAMIVAAAEQTAETASPTAPARDAPQLPIALLAGLAGGTLVFGLLGNWGRLASPAGLLAELVRGQEAHFWSVGRASLVLLALTALAGVGLAVGRSHPLRSRTAVVGIAILVPAGYGWLHATRLAQTPALEQGGASPLELARHVAGHFVTWSGLLLLVLATLTASLVRDHWPPRAVSSTTLGTVTAAAVLVAAAFALFTGATTVGRGAEVVLKHARARADAGAFAAAAPLFEHACTVLDHDDRCLLFQGRAGLEWAKRSPAGERERRLEWARQALEGAARRRPLDTDHAVNLGRFHVVAAGLASDDATRNDHWRDAHRAYERALTLFPGSAPILQESAVPLLALGDRARTQERIHRARAIDPSLPPFALAR